MSPQLQNILDLIKQSAQLNDVDKAAIEKAIKETDKALEIANFKLDRTEKVKRTTAILLEETIAELEQKRKAVEQQNRELEIESSLERVRTVAMSMKKPDDLLSICEILFKELQALGFNELRNALIHTYVDEKNYFVDYDFSDFTGGRISRIPYNSLPFIEKYLKEIRKSNDAFTEIEMGGKELEEWKDFRRTNGQLEDPRLDSALALYYYNYSIGVGDVGISTFHPITHEKREILKRFRNVFDLAYRRYIDIQQAEAQAREAKIEAALERIRSRSMGMQKSEELKEVIRVIYEQLVQLGFEINNAGFLMDYREVDGGNIWMADALTEIHSQQFVPYFDHIFNREYLEQKEKGPELFTRIYSFEEKNSWLENICKHLPWITEELKNLLFGSPSLVISRILLKNIGLYLLNYNGTPYTDAENATLLRIGKVFEQTYIRFNDLKKAEAQAREAKIEAALEKVRSRSLAMHKSDELREVVGVVFDKLQELGFHLTDGAVGIIIFSNASKEHIQWIADPGNMYPRAFHTPYSDHAPSTDIFNARESRLDFFSRLYPFEEKNRFFEFLFSQPDYQQVPDDVKKMIFTSKDYGISVALERNSAILIPTNTGELVSGDKKEILKRFAKVFEQCYIRFLDLQKAEAQAREAQIEVALERTRTQSMLMQHSKELDDTLRVFHQQVLLLGINSAFSFLWLPDEDKDRHIFWAAWGEDQNDSTIFKSKAINYPLDRNEPATAQCLVDWKSEEPVHSYNVSPAQVENYFAAWAELFGGAEKLKPEYFPNGLNYVEAFMKYGCFGVMIENELPEDEKKILLRFAIEFERTYTRFLDLQKAEAQAREAQIETALEKVRSRSLAMHKSEELNDVVMVLFEKLKELQIPVTAVGITIYIQGSKDMNMYVCGDIGNGLTINSYHLPYFDHAITNDLYDVRERELDFFVGNYSKEEKDSFYNYLLNQSALIELPGEIKNMIMQSPSYSVAMAPAKNSMINLNDFEGKSLSESQADVLKRFAKVFDQAYIRFLDLQKAEAQAREAQIEAALEKVRSRTMAMQSSDELADAAYVLFEQLNQLGIVHERINIGIVNEENQTIDFWVTGQGGNRITTRFSGRINEPTTLVKAYTAWKKGEKSLVIDQQGEDLQRWLKFMEEEIKIPFDKKYLHNRRVQTAGFFSKGMLVVTSPEPLQSEAIYLLEKFSGVFDLTYTRFNDLKIAEAHALQAEQDLIAIKEAKQKAEEALTELQLTQKQLIQSEKMASLGELTAGIAHEIQNPLNFVNNFSDVSKELLDEMKTELASGNLQLATEIADDVIGNLEKILHHGKRADGIVKGMLQHSRSSSGQKELTDINALTDEYLRLAYHGLRAKDKSFNARFETDFDTGIGKIEVMPQEIGRVILNLINNAFYAVSERQKAEGKEFEPTVTISTKKTGNKVLIGVKDNGNGIPDTIKEKIFQPFFTTKPTGQGTGLGLSLAYDIVKAHGGEIKVNTNEGEGTEFIISLPVNQ